MQSRSKVKVDLIDILQKNWRNERYQAILHFVSQTNLSDRLGFLSLRAAGLTAY